ncbi:putative Major facilitator superfamily (MFS) profile domain-containing protein [Seiridium unicorne]|uniref:Major facilitator superfamily (MFS) profile domain-containing protein n=1 Tax=Seiridium unicorne TaxID=138068 RepID=A0ABR2VEK5_9PEZI
MAVPNPTGHVKKGTELADTSRSADIILQPGQPSSPPKENMAAWVQVLGAFILNLNTWGIMNAYGAFQAFYQLNLLHETQSSSIAWIGSTQAFLLFLISLAAGPLFDAGYLRGLLWTGSFLLVALMTGLSLGCLYLPAPAVVSQYFHARTALAMGASSTGSAIGGIIYPIIFNQLQLRFGFGWATRVLAFILLATSAIPVLLMKSKALPKPTRSLVDHTAIKDAPYMVFSLGMFFGIMGFYIVLYYIELLALARTNTSPSLAAYLLVIINAASLPGRLIPGYYADRVGSIHVQIAVAIASVVLTLSLLVVHSSAGLIIFSVLYGFMNGAFMGLPAAGVISLSSDKSKIGTRLGMTLTLLGFGMLVSNPIAGVILGKDGNWVGLIVWCGSLLAASSISLITLLGLAGMDVRSYLTTNLPCARMPD